MKILFVGLGSAGQRHLRNIKRILGDDAEIFAYRVRKLPRLFDDNLSVIEGRNVTEEYKIKEFDELSMALKAKPDIAFITNPNSLHVSTALLIAEKGIDIFLEKPVSDSLDGISDLMNMIKSKKLICYVGFQMRLHPCVMSLKRDIDANKIGRIVSVDCQMGESLRKMHQYEDYRDMSESKRERGGGVVLCQIHELDYLYWIFGLPSEVYSIGGKYSELDIDVEDSVTTICKYKKEDHDFPIIIHQDFLQSPPVRKCSVVGELGCIEIDLLSNSYCLFKDNTIQEEKYKDFNRNDMFLKELSLFLEYVNSRKQNTLTLEEGLGSLKLALAIKKSVSMGQAIDIREI